MTEDTVDTPRPDLREALERIREHAERLHLDLVYVGPGAILDDPWSLLSAAEPSVPARCAECSEIEVNRVHNEPTLSAYHPFAALATTPPAPEPCEICGKPGHSVDACPAAEWGTLTPPAQPLPTEPDWGRMAYVLGLIGPVDTDDTEDAFVAYAEDIRAHYRRSDLETDSQYAAYVSRLSEARDE